MPGERAEVRNEFWRSNQDDSPERSSDRNKQVEIIYLPEGILTDHRRSGMRTAPADLIVGHDRRGNIRKRKNWSRRLNIAFTTLATTALILPAILTVYLGIGFHTVVTGSMRPTIQPGDLLISRILPVSQVKVGEVVLLLNPTTDKLQAHRVITKTTSGDSTTFVTKGDANPVPDTPVTLGPAALTRHVTTVVSKVGYVLSFLSSTLGKMISAGLFLIALILTIAHSLVVRRRRSDGRKQSDRSLPNRK